MIIIGYSYYVSKFRYIIVTVLDIQCTLKR